MQKLQGLYGITDGILQGDNEVLVSTVEQALLGGMKILQYRNKNENYTVRLYQAGILKALCHRYQALLIINDDVELAATVEADGVHLGQNDSSIVEARKRLGSYAIIGGSAENSIDFAEDMVDQGANYIAFSRFFPSKTKPDSAQADFSILNIAKKKFTVPILAIGGITLASAPKIIDAGADMVAVVRDLFATDNIQKQTKEYINLFIA